MEENTSAAVAYDIWPETEEVDESDLLKLAENDEDENAKAAPAASAKGTPEPDGFDQTAAEMEAFAEGKLTTPSSKVVKGFQRVIAKKDAEISELKRMHSETLAHFNARADKIEEDTFAISEANKLTWETLHSNLEDEPAARAELERVRRATAVLTDAQRRVQQRQQSTAPQQRAPEPAAWETELTQRIEQESKAFEDGLRETAELLGVAADDPNLDFGTSTQTFNERSKAFRASVKKAQEAALETSIASVRGKRVTTRGANGGEPPPPEDGMSRLERGANAHWNRMSKGTPFA